MRVERVDSDFAASWDRYVASKSEAHLYHTYAWREVIEEVFGRRCHYRAAFDDDECVRGVLPLAHLKSRVFGNFLVSLPYFNYGGVLADSVQVAHELLTAASELARENAVDHVELR